MTFREFMKENRSVTRIGIYRNSWRYPMMTIHNVNYAGGCFSTSLADAEVLVARSASIGAVEVVLRIKGGGVN